MSSIQEHTTQVLKSLKALAGEVIFHAALAAVQGNAVVSVAERKSEPKVEVKTEPAPEPETKAKRRTNNISDEQRSERAHNMAALQAFTKAIKKELTDSGGDPKEAKRVAGARWKAMSKEEKKRWADEHMNTTEVASVCAVCQDPIVDTDTHRECVREAVEEAKAEGKTEDEAIRQYVDASGGSIAAVASQVLEPTKRGRGRPKGLGPAPGVNVRRLSKTETAALEEGPPGSVPN